MHTEPASFRTKSTRREIFPAAQTMRDAAAARREFEDVEAAGREFEENAVALAVEISLAEVVHAPGESNM